MPTMTSSQPERNFDELLLLLQDTLREHLARPHDREPLRQALKLLAALDLRLGPSGSRDVAALFQQMVRFVAGLAQGLLTPSQESAYLLARAALEIPAESEIDGNHRARTLRLLAKELQALRDDSRGHAGTTSPSSPCTTTADSPSSPTTSHSPAPSRDKSGTRAKSTMEAWPSQARSGDSRAPRAGSTVAPVLNRSDEGSHAAIAPDSASSIYQNPLFTGSLKKEFKDKPQPVRPTSRRASTDLEPVDALDDARHRFQAALLLVCRESDARAAAHQLIAVSGEISAALPGTSCGALFEGTKRLAADIARTGAEPSPAVKRLLGRVDRQLGQCLRSFRQPWPDGDESARGAAWKVPVELIIAVRDAVAAPGEMATAWSNPNQNARHVPGNTRRHAANVEPREQSTRGHKATHNHSVTNRKSIDSDNGRQRAAVAPDWAPNRRQDSGRQPDRLADAMRLFGRLGSGIGAVIVALALAPIRLLAFSGGLLVSAVKGTAITGWLVVQGTGEILYLTGTVLGRAIAWITLGAARGVFAVVRGVTHGIVVAVQAIGCAVADLVRGVARGIVVAASGIAWVLGTAAREVAFAVSATVVATINSVAAVGRGIVRVLVTLGLGIGRLAKSLISGTSDRLVATYGWTLRSASLITNTVVRAFRLSTNRFHRSLSYASRHLSAFLQTGIAGSVKTVRKIRTGTTRAVVAGASSFRDLAALPSRILTPTSDTLARLAAILVLRLWAGKGSLVRPQVATGVQRNGTRLASFLLLAFQAPGKLLKVIGEQLLRLHRTGQPDYADSTCNNASGLHLIRPAIALAFLGGLGISAMMVSNVLRDETIVDSGAESGHSLIGLIDRQARCDFAGQQREPFPSPSTHAAHECPPATETLVSGGSGQPLTRMASLSRHGSGPGATENPDYGPERPSAAQASNDQQALTTLLGLNGPMGADSVAVAWQVASDREGIVSAGSGNPLETGVTESPDNDTGLAALLGLNGDMGATLVRAAWPLLQDHHGPVLVYDQRGRNTATGHEPTSLASLTGLDGGFSKELSSKAWQVLQDHQFQARDDSPGESRPPASIAPVLRLASLLGPDSHLAAALVGSAPSRAALPDPANARANVPAQQVSKTSPIADGNPRLIPAGVWDHVTGARPVLAVWAPSVDTTQSARSRGGSRVETNRAATTTTERPRLSPTFPAKTDDASGPGEAETTAPLLLASYSAGDPRDHARPNISRALGFTSLGSFRPSLSYVALQTPSLSADDRDLDRRIEASLERNRRQLPTSYQLLDLDLEPARPTGLMWSNHTLREGDNLSALWSSVWKLPSAVLYRILADSESASLLNRVHPGQEVAWQTDANGDVIRLRLWHDRLSGTEWVLADDGQGFVRNEVKKTRGVQHIALTAHIDEDIATSLASRTELSASAARSLTILLERHLPMHDEKVRPGDRFSLLIEQEMIEGDDTPYEIRLLAFDYQGDLIDLTAVRNTDGRFYTPEGKSLLPAFDRKPFVGSFQVSSSYNLRRRHPVTGRTAPHHGTDFAMPVGTPIQAPADGKVTHVHTHPHAGRYLVIEHGQGYTTRYLHLQRTLVRPGQTVRRGERIALSGNTGRTTGPHLHYELHVDGVPVDAMRAELPEAKSLAGIHLEQFQNNAQPLLAALRNADPSRQIAMRPFPSQDP